MTVEHRGERAEIRADVVVNAGGMFAPEIGRMAGVTVPIIPMAHQYLFTEPVEGVHPGLPQLRDPDNLVYFREEVGGLCMGGYERDPAPWALDGIPADFNGKLLAPDMARFEPIMEGAIRRVPAMADAGVNRVINGPEAFTPDNEFILGESEVRGFFVAAGFSAHGIAGAGGIGRQMATWIVDGAARAGPLEDGHPAVRAGLPLAGVHAGALDRELRDLLRHPLPQRGAAVGPSAADVAGLRAASPASARRSARSPAGSARTGSSRTPSAGDASTPAARVGRPPLVAGDRGRGAGDPAHGRPLRRDRRSPSSRSAGRGGARSSQRLCANDVDRPVGSIVYTQLLDVARRHRGGPDGHAARAGVVPARDRDRLREPRRGLAAPAPARGRVGGGPRRHVGACLLRAVGSARPGTSSRR